MVRVLAAPLLFLTLLLATASGAFGAGGPPSERDGSFGRDGVSKIPVSTKFELSSFDDVLALPDGSVVAAGGRDLGSDAVGGPLVARFDSDGNLDPDFADDGVLDDFVPATNDGLIGGLARTLDGRIIGIGKTGDGSVFVVALLPDGRLDPSFGSDGLRFIDQLDGPTLAGHDVDVLSGGRIQFTVKTHGSDGAQVHVIRLLPDGTDDPSFGDHGVATLSHTELPPGGGIANCGICLRDLTVGMAVDGKNRTWLSSPPSNGMVMNLIRLDSRGKLDRSVGDGSGLVGIEFDSAGHTTYGVGAGPLAITPDGGVVAAGPFKKYRHGSESRTGLAFARLDSRGRLVKRFGTGGKVVYRTPDESLPEDLAIGPGGSILSAGATRGANYRMGFAALELRPNGTPNHSFGTDGLVLDQSGGDGATGIAVDRFGHILLSGFSESDKAQASTVIRYSLP